jgi:hypothetical protein
MSSSELVKLDPARKDLDMQEKKPNYKNHTS